MRGDDIQQDAMFSYVSPEERVPAAYPLRPIRQMVDTLLKGLSPRFEANYAEGGRPSARLHRATEMTSGKLTRADLTTPEPGME